MAPLDLTSDKLDSYKQQALDDLHSRYLEPAVDSLSKRAQGHPVRASFLGVFALFAFLPVVAWTCFAVGTILVVGGTALVVATVIISWALATAGLVLFGVLCFAAFFSVLATLSLGATYASYRFYTILKQSETLPDAIQDFQDEAAALLLPGSYQDGETSSKVRFNGVVKKEDGEGASLNDEVKDDLKSVGA
ncbi:hypothetical protein JCM9279_003718 [Rhodotorula babjevae]